MGSVVLDADVIIGFLDPADAQHARAVRATTPWLSGGHELALSASVYAEILVRPIRRGTDQTVDAFLDAARAQVVPVDAALARQAAFLRARHESLRLPEALSLAAALGRGADFLTLDRRLQRIHRAVRPAG